MKLQIINWNTALLSYSLMRRTERSVDHILVSYFLPQSDNTHKTGEDESWSGLMAYYDEPKRQSLRRAVQLICPEGCPHPKLASDHRDVFAPLLDRRYSPVTLSRMLANKSFFLAHATAGCSAMKPNSSLVVYTDYYVCWTPLRRLSCWSSSRCGLICR
jgi:hypothetical protein